MLNDLITAVDKGDASILALLDQSPAFDTVDHAILLDRLSAPFGVTDISYSWFSSYLSGRRQSVSVSGFTSSPCPLLFSMAQGSVLGPILYILYNSPLHEIVVKFGVADHSFSPDIF